MAYDPQKHHRRSIRLRGYDYSSSGLYFLTICTHQRQRLFGEVVDGVMRLSDFGRVAAAEWVKSADIRREIECDEWVVMPDHVHGIVRIVGANGRGTGGDTTGCGDMDGVHRDMGANGHLPDPNDHTTEFGDTDGSHDGVVGVNGHLPLRDYPPRQTDRRVCPPMKPRSVSSFVTGFKSAVTKQINILRNARGTPVWQRNYYDRIIRDEAALFYIRRYIRNNPAAWHDK